MKGRGGRVARLSTYREFYPSSLYMSACHGPTMGQTTTPKAVRRIKRRAASIRDASPLSSSSHVHMPKQRGLGTSDSNISTNRLEWTHYRHLVHQAKSARVGKPVYVCERE